jgi:hypothetical protein
VKTLIIRIQIDDAPGIFTPKPNEIHMHVRRAIITFLGGMQRYSSMRSLTAMYATVNAMVHTELEIEK